MKTLFALTCCVLVITGCSVGMAMSGKDAPNLGAFGIGSPRSVVEVHMGQPVTSTTMPDGTRVDVYTYEIGNAPSAGRAAGHAAMDVLTLGIWEIVGTPIEAYQGETKHLAVTYSPEDRVLTMGATTLAAK